MRSKEEVLKELVNLKKRGYKECYLVDGYYLPVGSVTIEQALKGESQKFVIEELIKSLD